MLVALLAIGLVVVALLFYASTRPPTFRIERSTHVDATMLQVAELIDDFRAWRRWSPWEQLDPALRRTYSGADAGVGAVYEWNGNGKAGAGRMEITGMDAGAARAVITIRLDFLSPVKATHTAEFVMTPGADGTDLSWAMFGRSPFVSRLMGVFIDLDKLVGKDFEAGLAALKHQAEQAKD
jgi:hypothetical protein